MWVQVTTWACLLYDSSSRVIFMIRAFSFRLLSFNLNNNKKQEGEEIFFSQKKKLFSIYTYILTKEGIHTIWYKVYANLEYI